MHIVVIGGTGFIGYHLVNLLLQQKHQVTLLSRSPARAKSLFSDQVEVVQGDLSAPESIDYDTLFADADALVYAAGIDERAEPEGDIYEFFHKENVITCIQVIDQAKAHNVKQVVVLGSIFTYIDRTTPELELVNFHPYIRSRYEQQLQALALADNDFQVNVVEIPYVFGAAPGCDSLWKSIIMYVRIGNPLVVTPGGANAISVKTLALAIAGVLNHVEESGPVPVGDENITWEQMLTRISQQMQNKPRKVVCLPLGLFSELTKIGAVFQDLLGMKSGLDQHRIHEIITNESFMDASEAKALLHYSGGDLDEAFADTVHSCPKPTLKGVFNNAIDTLNNKTLDYLKKLDHRANQSNT